VTPPLFVSFFTPTYTAEAAGLVESLESFGLPFDVRPVPDRGSWHLNTAFKATFLRKLREERPRTPLIFLDADARVMERPRLFSGLDRYDLAAHYFRGTELASGTLYLSPTPESYELVRRWEWRCQRQPELLDQRALQIEAEAMPGLTTYRLPAAYCFIHDLSNGEAVVLHRQMSRTLR
jgi:hypothetical protein